MARSSRMPKKGGSRASVFSERLYGLFLYSYPTDFRRAYGLRMVRVFRDSCREALQRRGLVGLILLWLQTLPDLLVTACLEQWSQLKEASGTMATSGPIARFPLRLRVALVATMIAFGVSLLASLNLYLLEDASALTQGAYAASPLLQFSYDGIYLSALAAGVGVCAIIAYALVQRPLFVNIGLTIMGLVVALGGFGGLIRRHPLTFVIFIVVFSVLILVSLWLGRVVTKRLAGAFGQRSAAIMGACVGLGIMLFINVVAVVLHTLILNPVSHALYMQSQIEGTHLNSALISMALVFLAFCVCVVSLGRALRLPPAQRL